MIGQHSTTERERSDRFQRTGNSTQPEIGRFAPVLKFSSFLDQRRHVATAANPSTNLSICARVFVSVTHTKKSLSRAGKNCESAKTPSLCFSWPRRDSNLVAFEGPRTTNSLKQGPE